MSRRLPSTSLGGGECDGYLLVLATVLCCRASYIASRASVACIIIILLNILSRVKRVTIGYIGEQVRMRPKIKSDINRNNFNTVILILIL